MRDRDFWQEDVLYIFSRLPAAGPDGRHDMLAEVEYAARALKMVQSDASNMLIFQKLLKELRVSTSRVRADKFPLGAVRGSMRALLDYLGPISDDPERLKAVPPSSYICIETLLSIGQHHGLLEPNDAGDDLMSLLVHSPHSTEVLANFGFYFCNVLEYNADYIERGETPPLTHSRGRTADAMMAIILSLLGLAMQVTSPAG